MINNNTPSGLTSESTIYLKKSDLPKNVSYFKNDAKYISETALANWLAKHSYISKDDIKSLIEKANLAVIDTINKSTDYIAINNLNDEICNLNGEITEIKDLLKNHKPGSGSSGDINPSDFVNISDFNSIKDIVEKLETDLSQLEPNKYLTEHQSLAGYATEDWVKNQGYLTEDDIKSTTNKFAIKSEIEDEINKLKFEIPSLSGYTTEEWVKSQGYLTEDDIKFTNKFAIKSEIEDEINKLRFEIPSLSGYATETWVKNQGYLTKHQDLSDYATKTTLLDYLKRNELSDALKPYAKKSEFYTKAEINKSLKELLSKTDASEIYLPKTDAEKIYITKKDVAKEYLAIEDYRGLKDATVLSDEYKHKTRNDLKNDLETLMNGFYIVDVNDIVLVKNHDIISVFEDGIVTPTIYWREEE